MSESVNYSKFRWFAAIALVFVTASTSFTMLSPAPLIGEIVKTLGVTPGEATAMTMFTFNMVMACFALVGGVVVDKLGVARTWVIGLGILMLGSLLTPIIANSPAGLVTVRVLHAIGTGPIMASIAPFCAQYFKYSERTYVAALQGFAVSGGISVAFMITPRVFMATGDWHTAVAMTSIEIAIGLVFALIVLFGPKPPVIVKPTVSATKEPLFSGDFKKAFASATVYILAMMAFIDSWCQQVYNDMAPGFYAQNQPLGLGFGPMGASKLAWASYAMMLGTLVAPVVTEKLFKGKPQPTIFVGLLIAAASVFTFRYFTPQSSDAVLVLVPCVVLFFSSFVNPTVFGYVAKHYPEHVAGKIGGFVMAISVFGAAIGLAISSFLLHKTGFYWQPMNVLVFVTLVGAVVVFALRPPKGFNFAAEQQAKLNK